jgi:hypothetical protein
MPKIFVSHASADRAFAHELGRLMEERGASVFLDTDKMTAGSLWSETLRAEIDMANALVLVIPSHDVANRNWVWFEAGAAKALGKPVLAVLPPQHGSVQLPTDIADVLVLDADRRSPESVADMLLEAISGERAEPAAAK